MAESVRLSASGKLVGSDGQPIDMTIDDVTLDEIGVTKISVGTVTTPITTQSAYTQTYSTASKTVANATTHTITDSSTGTASTTAVAAGVGVTTLTLPVPANMSTLSTGGVDVASNIVIDHKFKILSWEFITTLAGTGSSASLVFNLEIGTTNVGTSPSTCTVTLAATSAIGARIAGTAVSGANTGNAGDNLSLEVAAGGTAFTAGSGYFVIKIQNMDTADAFATILAEQALANTDSLTIKKNVTAVIDDAQAFGLVG